jgi:alpha-L-arabinofuranosidase
MKTMHADLSGERQFKISPHLFMQMMEPLGTTNPSVDVAWDFRSGTWREDVVVKTRALAPGMIRWPGGILTAYYRWKEAIGPRDRRTPMFNIEWGGMESNQVGTHEFIDFCRAVNADPLIAVNFESEHVEQYSRDPVGSHRSAGPEEAAEWVDYCNNPSNAQRAANGASEPFAVRTWQIGNETSYAYHAIGAVEAAELTVRYADAMHRADPEIDLIGWGDRGHAKDGAEEWAPRMIETAGEHLRYIAFHHHWDSGLDDSPLTPNLYREDPDRTWTHLMNAHRSLGRRLDEMRDMVAGTDLKLAMTEGHFALPGHDRCDVLASWAAGVAYARALNEQIRRADVLEIATLADFCGNLWNVNALMIPAPHYGKAYLMPVGHIMSLCRNHIGTHTVKVETAGPDAHVLDIAGSRDDDRYYLFVANTDRTTEVAASFSIDGVQATAGRAFVIADDPSREINATCPDIFQPVERLMADDRRIVIPAASVAAIELDAPPE